MQTSPSRILIFDSGVGALSVFQEIRRALPDIHCSLAFDNAQFPYGTLSESKLIERVIRVVGELIKQTDPELAVIACNTASTLVLNELRKGFDIPFVGVVPAIKPAARLSSSQSIGLLATPATIERSYTENLIEDFAPNCEILRIGSTDLVYMAEQKLRGRAVDLARLAEIVAPFVAKAELDSLVLACTHFPLLREELSKVLPERIQMVDSGSAIAQRVVSLLNPSGLKNSEPHNIYLTRPDAELESIGNHFHAAGFNSAKVLAL